MEVILLESVNALVKPGYARNFLFPRRLALPATESNRRVFQERRRLLEKRDRQARESAQALAARLESASVTIGVQVGEEDRLYGSVGTADVARALAEQGFEIDRRQILLEEPIRQLGVYTVDVRLHREVSAPVKVWVVKS